MTDDTSTLETQRDGQDDGSTAPLRLEGAQRQIAEAYCDADAGLFALDCVPGAGKSVVRNDLAAKELLARYAAGDPTPEQHVCVITFTRAEAATITAEIIERVRAIVEHNVTPVATTLTAADAERLAHRIRQAPYIGTIDSVLRTIFEDIVGALGFDEEPAIGDEARLQQLHRECYTAITTDSTLEAEITRLTTAYPSGEYDDGLEELLRQALEYCRNQQLTVEAFNSRLVTSVEAVYEEGEPTAVDDLLVAIARCVSTPEAKDAMSELRDRDTDAILAADAELRQAWMARIDDFCAVLAAYLETYERKTREHGVISHVDCAFLVAEYFASATVPSDDADSTPRQRALARHQQRVEAWLIDEAQDLSRVQHNALAPFVTDSDRVFLAGDLRQSIYGWRAAHPTRFQTALTDGAYFGVDWETHTVNTATRTYRCRPDVSAAITAITEPILTDPERGNLGDLDVRYPGLEAVRDPTDDPSLHVAAFTPRGVPGTADYVTPDTGKGEADITATYLACGLADGTLTPAGHTPAASDATESPSVTVLFRRRRYMDAYADAFEAEGLEVAAGTAPLFAAPAVEAVLEVVEWLTAPTDPTQTERLITETPLKLDSLTEYGARYDWDLDAIAADADGLSDRQTAILSRFNTLREMFGGDGEKAGVACVDAVITQLDLRADPLGLTATADASQRVRNLDAFTAWVSTVTSDEQLTTEQFTERVASYRETPGRGPTQPAPQAQDADVEFKTIHEMKGDEADVVVVADLGFRMDFPGATQNRFITADDVAALAPPETDRLPLIEPLAKFQGGLYRPATETETSDHASTDQTTAAKDIGLRWVTERWQSQPDSSPATLVGHDHLQRVPQERRAEAWRLLYVALTRAREHIVLPLPRKIYDQTAPRNRWLESIYDAIEFKNAPRAGTYTIDVPTPGRTADRELTIGVNDVSLEGSAADTPPAQTEPTQRNGALHAGSTPCNREALPKYIPRILRPSTLAPLLTDPEQWLLAHLQNDTLQTETDAVDVDLPFDTARVDPAVVGDVIHRVLMTLITRADLQTDPTDQLLRAITDSVISTHLRDHPTTAQEGVQEFIHKQILPSFLDSACWEKISHAEQVHIEKPLPGRVRVDQIEFEFDGNGDLVLRNPDGTWEIIDLKITLTDLTANAKRRYALQVATYRYLLQTYVEGAVETSIEVFGVCRDTISANQASSTQGDETWLKNLLHGSILERDAMTISIDETG